MQTASPHQRADISPRPIRPACITIQKSDLRLVLAANQISSTICIRRSTWPTCTSPPGTTSLITEEAAPIYQFPPLIALEDVLVSFKQNIEPEKPAVSIRTPPVTHDPSRSGTRETSSRHRELRRGRRRHAQGGRFTPPLTEDEGEARSSCKTHEGRGIAFSEILDVFQRLYPTDEVRDTPVEACLVHLWSRRKQEIRGDLMVVHTSSQREAKEDRKRRRWGGGLDRELATVYTRVGEPALKHLPSSDSWYDGLRPS